ncbi:MAG TPA: ribbon-helix-helix protein, CopG family [Solirubrobacterales bacterium]|jgi:hypothetical protein
MAGKTKYPITKAGIELTPAVADALARGAEEGPDLSNARLRPVGRPSLSGAGHSPRINLRLSDDIYEAARSKAAERGETLSELAREAIRRYVEA